MRCNNHMPSGTQTDSAHRRKVKGKALNSQRCSLVKTFTGYFSSVYDPLWVIKKICKEGGLIKRQECGSFVI